MSQHIGPRTISAIGGSVKRVGNYRVHTFPSELVTDGLVLNLDAGDPRSYPSSGTTWTDLSGNGNNGTLNGPTYSNADGGALVFDGTDDYVTGTLPLITGEVTIEAWVKFDGVTNRQTIFTQGQDAVSFSCGLVVSNSNIIFRNTFSDHTFSSPSTLVSGQWYHLVISSSTILTSGYVNGISNGTTSNIVSTNNIQTFKIGQRPGISTESLDGNISIVRVYNRALSAAEVAQNYDALRVRYGAYTNTFTPICGGEEGKVEVLCVAGGGGGGRSNVGPSGSPFGGGGGGAGGLLYNSAFSVNSSSNISVTVGSGGSGGASNNTRGSSGNNSTFSSLTSIGGGGGGASGGQTAGLSGGSGGGAAYPATSSASGTSGQGFSGGANNGSNGAGAGGGGAGGPGGPNRFASFNSGGLGGDGLSYSISGNSQFYSGGGGGGAYYAQADAIVGSGGSGIGGNGSIQNGSALSAIPNTGSGGGGSIDISGNGSNGIVIVRYPATDYNVEVLVVGGGGAGGSRHSGGGGAGGVIYNSKFPVTSGTNIPVNVGAGGIAGTILETFEVSPKATNGSNSIFGTLVAIGGGAGGLSASGEDGGSGGGAGDTSGASVVGGSGVSGQGNDGGDYPGGNYTGGAGGGGAGGAGSNGGSNSGGSGGPGLQFSISGTPTYYGGGGGGAAGYNKNSTGGSGGLGGGGRGDNSFQDGATCEDGDPNTGGGGGAHSTNYPNIDTGRAGDGGSGIVIIAYKGPQRGIGGTVDTTSRPGYTLHKFTTTGTDFFIP